MSLTVSTNRIPQLQPYEKGPSTHSITSHGQPWAMQKARRYLRRSTKRRNGESAVRVVESGVGSGERRGLCCGLLFFLNSYRLLSDSHRPLVSSLPSAPADSGVLVLRPRCTLHHALHEVITRAAPTSQKQSRECAQHCEKSYISYPAEHLAALSSSARRVWTSACCLLPSPPPERPGNFLACFFCFCFCIINSQSPKNSVLERIS